MVKRLLLTGISGSIGVHFLAHIMHNTDWDVVGIDSFRHKGLSDRLHEVVKDHPDWNGRWSVITHDLTAPISEMTKKKIGHIDYIISMASLSDVYDSIENPVPFVQNNVNLVLNMLEYARSLSPQTGISYNGQQVTESQEGLKAFIQISTDEVYGPTDGKTGLKEWSPILPSNPYAGSKACQEALAIAYWRTYNVPIIITNTMNNFGEMQSSAKYPVMVQKKIEGGDTVTIHGKEGEIGSRSYIHSRNFADAVLFILKNLPPYIHTPDTVDRPDRYNITGDRQLDNLELAQLTAELMGEELKYELQDSQFSRPGHDKHYGLDGEKLREKGWSSPVSFEKSLLETIKWQRENPLWLK